jgi:predicted RNA-binding Zn-ribbon protein involved in translation (DUF1610 family)
MNKFDYYGTIGAKTGYKLMSLEKEEMLVIYECPKCGAPLTSMIAFAHSCNNDSYLLKSSVKMRFVFGN